jgi:hypothetical protein
VTAAVLSTLVIDEPGVYDDIPAEVYHADPVAGGSLSSSAAKKLLACPAKYAYERAHPRPPKKEFDLGHAVHRLVLGAGTDLVVVEADNWRTKAAQQARADAYAAGKTPLLLGEWDQVQAMHDALLSHWAGQFFRGGVAEQVAVWRDEATGVMCRAMLDYRVGQRICDYKTAASVNPADLDDAVYRFGYDLQRAFYAEAVQAVGLVDGPPSWVFVAQEKEPPYLVTAFELDGDYAAIGAAKARRAREVWRDCTTAGTWPGYPGTDDVVTIAPPRWARIQEEENSYR